MNAGSAAVLIIEDDADIRRGVVDSLELDGFRTIEAGRANDGLAAVSETDCALVLLDLVLPDGDGLDVLEQIRRVRPRLPVIILTARGDEPDRIRGLKLGADDYVVKPFSVAELTARVEAVLRRTTENGHASELAIPGGKVDFERSRAEFDDGDSVELSEREVDILRHLASRSGVPVSRTELLAEVWKIDPRGIQSRTIDMHVARLREKLRDASDQPRFIRTVRGRGYMLEVAEAAS